MPRLSKDAIIERLKSMADPELGTLEEAFRGSKDVKCPACREAFSVAIPDATAVRAALETLKLIPGIGTTNKIERSMPTGDSWRDLIQVLKEYPLPERAELARQILPEFSSLLARIECFETSSAGESPAEPTN